MIYTFLTWVIANLLHPLIWIAWAAIDGGGILSVNLFQVYFLHLLWSFLFSLPSLFIGRLLAYAIKYIPVTTNQKYFTWILLAILIPLVNLIILQYIEKDFFKEFHPEGAIPASIAVMIAVLIRIKQFRKFLSESEFKDYEITQPEN